jgi:hypothetical protein
MANGIPNPTFLGAASGTATSMSLTAQSTPGGGCIVVFGFVNSNSITMSCADTAGNTYSASTLHTGNAQHIQVFYCLNCKDSSSNTITITPSSSIQTGVQGYYISGGAITGYDSSAEVANGVTSNTVYTTPSFSTTDANEITFAFFASALGGGDTWTTPSSGAGSGWTGLQSSSLTGSAWNIWTTTQTSIQAGLNLQTAHAGICMAASFECNPGHTQAITATPALLAATTAKTDDKNIAAIQPASTASFAKMGEKSINAVSSLPAATVTKTFEHLFPAVALPQSATFTRTADKNIAAQSTTNTATFSKSATKAITAIPAALTGSVQKGFSRSLAALGSTFMGVVGRLYPMAFLANAPTLWQNGFQYLTTATVTNGQVLATLTNFPVYLSLSSPNLATVANGGAVQNTVTQTVGSYSITVPADFLVTTDPAGFSPISGVEFESYDPVHGTATLWVNVPTVHTTGTTIYIWYGNAAVSTLRSTPTAAWNSNYNCVYHLSNGLTLYLNDSTSNADTGTANGSPTATGGQLGGGVSLASTDSITTANKIQANTTPTISCWVNVAAYPSSQTQQIVGIVSSSKNGITLGINPSGQPVLYLNTTTPQTLTSTTALTTGAWHHIAGVDSGTLATLYLDGVQVAQVASSNVGTAFGGPGLQIGGTGEYTPGAFVVDEVRLENTGRGASWVSSSFNNQSNPNGFFALQYDLTVQPLPMSAASLSKNAARTINATSKANAVTLQKTTNDVWTATQIPSSATITKAIDKSITATPPAATVTWTKSIARAFTGQLTVLANGVTKSTSHSFTAVQNILAGGVSKSLQRTLAAIQSKFVAAFSGTFSDTATQNQTGHSYIVNANQTLDLTAYFDTMAMTTDGFTYGTTSGICGQDDTLSATLIGSSLTFDRIPFVFGPANTNNAVIGNGIPIPVSPWKWTKLAILATTVSNSQQNQNISVQYSNAGGAFGGAWSYPWAGNTGTTFTQSFSVFNNPQGYSNEASALPMSYIDSYDGTTATVTVYIFEYEFALDPTKTLQSITLPDNPNIAFLSITLVNAPQQGITGTSRIQVSTSKTQTGVSKIRAVTTQTITGNAEIEGTTKQTITGTSRIRISTTKTQTGVSRIKAVTVQTISGTSKIHNTTVQTQTGVSRILVTGVTKTQSGVSRVQVSTTQTQSGRSRIRVTTTKTQNAATRIQITTTKTISGVSRVQVATTQNISGVSRIHVAGSGTPTITGTSRVQVTTTKTQSAVSRIQIATTKNISAVSRVRIATTQNQNGVAKIKAVTTQTISGVSRIRVSNIHTQNGVSRVQVATVQTIGGISRIRETQTKTQNAVSRIQVTTVQTIGGVSRIYRVDVQNLNGVSRIKVVGQTKTLTGAARVWITTTHTQAAISRIQIKTVRTITGTARLGVTTQRSITGHSAIVRNPHVNYVQRNGTNKVKRNAPLNTVIRRLWERLR